MYLSPQTTKFIEEREHYLRRNAKEADDLTNFDFQKIAAAAGVSLKTVMSDVEAYGFDLKSHRPRA